MRRILVLHSRYLSGPLSGENQVVESEVRLLRDAGHEVTVFDPEPGTAGPAQLAATAAGAIWSRSASDRVRSIVRDRRVEVVHVHNLFPALSPAVLRAATAAGAAVVMSLHSYRLFCMAGTLLRDGRSCELCLGRSPLPGVRYRCYRGSAVGSGAMATSILLHRGLGTLDHARLFLPVSEFVLRKHAGAGIPPERMMVKPNFAWPVRGRDGPGSYFLYAGRLSPEKGVAELLAVWPKEAPLVVVGDGSDARRIRAAAGPQVDVRDPVDRAGVNDALREARALVLPSLAPEAAPRSLIEAAAGRVPAIASSVGGIPEVVEDGRSGLLVRPHDTRAFVAAVERLSDDAESIRMGTRAHEVWKDRFSPTPNLSTLERAYDRALGGAEAAASR